MYKYEWGENMDRIFYDYIKEDLNAAHCESDGFQGNMHFHRCFEMSFVVSGVLSVIGGGVSADIDGPCVIFHAPCSFHKLTAKAGVNYERYKYHFNDAYVEKYIPGVFERCGIFKENLALLPLTGKVGEAVLPVLRLYPENGSRPEEYERHFAFLVDLAARFYGERIPLGSNESNGNSLGYIGEILSYISENYASELKIEDLSKRFYVNRTKLGDDFKAVIGKTVKQHILDVRITNAMKMLTSGATVIETAHKCGFADESHFIRTFRERVGSSPKKFQRGADR